MVVMLGVMFILSTQPMMVISSLILTVLVYSIYLYWNLSSFWFSYMLILVLMSGVLVVFTYMMSVLPNEGFEVSSLVMLVLGVVFMTKYSGYDEYFMDMSMGSMKIWMSMTLVISVFLVIYLLVMMVMVVWLSMLEKGAIRIS
uniref:NADH dehydrogenase subunit 6 n=1 Tax=Cyrtophora moluccensis TaxID=299645 RepID=A0A0D3RBW6_9ARAC|nr:NADH dehydrogenase subunit 6 [Cyrtophora moluccensis]